MPTLGPVVFTRGIQETVVFDEAAFEGTGAFLLGAVLEQFFAKYVTINSFTELLVKTVERGDIMRWPARAGQRYLL
jgi:type VI secretion system protein ImpG